MGRLRAIGVDACRAGWVVAVGDVDEHGTAATVVLSVVRDFAAVLAMDADRIAIDIPIGLEPERRPGGRAADVATRSLLDLARGASVFPAPPRPALALRSFNDPRRAAYGLTQQSFALIERIRDVDDHVAPALQDPGRSRPFVMEVHPELVFADLDGGIPQPASKRSDEGRLRRRLLLEAAFGRPIPVIHPPGAADDDVLDALACLWVAASPVTRLSAIPAGDPPRDERGLAMRIWRRDAPNDPNDLAHLPRRSTRAALVDRLLGLLGGLEGVEVARGPERRHAGVPDLRLRTATRQVLVVVETSAAGGSLAGLWPELHEQAVTPPSLAVEVYAGPAGDRELHHRHAEFLLERMGEDLGPRGLATGRAWDAVTLEAGPGVEDPLPYLADRIRDTLRG